MPERQKHGFNFEDLVIKEENLIKAKGYTNTFDAFDKLGIPYQIKLIKYKSSIDLGDIFRNAKKEENFYLIVGFWKEHKENIVEIYKLYIDFIKWNKLFEFEYYDSLKNWITNEVSNSKEYDPIWKEEIKEWKKLFGKREVAIRFKRDHKKQRRIQCAINNSNFYNYFIKEFECQSMV